MGNVTERTQSEFNMSVSYLGLLNSIYYVSAEASLRLDAHMWMHSLRTLYRTVSNELTEKEIQDYKIKFTQLNELLQKNNKNIMRTGQNQITPELYDGLEEIQMFLISVLKRSGLLIKMKQAAGDSLEA